MSGGRVEHGTGIQWTHVPGYRGETWNPTTGCTRVSPGCDQCYAFALHDQRYATNLEAAKRGAGLLEADPERRMRDDESWSENVARVGAPPEGWVPRARALGVKLPHPAQYDRPFSQVQVLDGGRLEVPLHWRRPRAIFVDSMADLFHEDVPDSHLTEVWNVMARATQHIFMVLTKRPERMREWLLRCGDREGTGYITHDGSPPEVFGGTGTIIAALKSDNPHVSGGTTWPLPNVWLGVSAEDQERAVERIPVLLDTPAAVRFVSAEPLLGPIDFGAIDAGDGPFLDWVIVGGESGPHARPMDLAWARSIVEQARAAGVACFVKQLGSHAVSRVKADTNKAVTGSAPLAPEPWRVALKHSHGGNPEEWPEGLRVREWPRGVAS